MSTSAEPPVPAPPQQSEPAPEPIPFIPFVPEPVAPQPPEAAPVPEPAAADPEVPRRATEPELPPVIYVQIPKARQASLPAATRAPTMPARAATIAKPEAPPASEPAPTRAPTVPIRAPTIANPEALPPPPELPLAPEPLVAETGVTKALTAPVDSKSVKSRKGPKMKGKVLSKVAALRAPPEAAPVMVLLTKKKKEGVDVQPLVEGMLKVAGA